jgi:hypothetical protein
MFRAELQRTFFPPVYQDSSPTPRLRPGDTRAWPALKVFVELRDATTLQIPFKEPSKVKYILSYLTSVYSPLSVGLAMGRGSRIPETTEA